MHHATHAWKGAARSARTALPRMRAEGHVPGYLFFHSRILEMMAQIDVPGFSTDAASVCVWPATARAPSCPLPAAPMVAAAATYGTYAFASTLRDGLAQGWELAVPSWRRARRNLEQIWEGMTDVAGGAQGGGGERGAAG